VENYSADLRASRRVRCVSEYAACCFPPTGKRARESGVIARGGNRARVRRSIDFASNKSNNLPNAA
jgi:hypothetical protein